MSLTSISRVQNSILLVQIFQEKKKHNGTCLLFINICINETGINNTRKTTKHTGKYDRIQLIFHI